MRLFTLISIALLAGFSTSALATEPIRKPSIPQLEQRLSTIDSELEELAGYSLRSGVGSIGYCSKSYPTDHPHEWVEVDFGKRATIDQVVLVPTLYRDSHKGFQADGFPLVFRIWAGTENDRTGKMIAEVDARDGILPRIAPLVVEVDQIEASWIQIEATKLSRQTSSNRYVFQLSELLVFSGGNNVALRRPVLSSSANIAPTGAWNPEFLVDGHMPYMMDAAQGRRSRAYVGYDVKPLSFTIDLEKTHPISQIHLHAVEQGDTAPKAFSANYGMPANLKVEGATRADFSDATLLLETDGNNLTQTGPIMMWPIKNNDCRFVRITATTPTAGFHLSYGMLQELSVNPTKKERAKNHYRMGYSEIEIISEGKNIASGKPIKSSVSIKGREIKLRALTDGRNLYGNIITIKKWINQLAQRHDLEHERPIITAALNDKYRRQKSTLKWLGLLASLLPIGIGITILIARILQKKRITQIQERFAADLHDELGANLHTISLLSNLVKKKVPNLTDEGSQLLQRICSVSQRSSVAIRHMSEIHNSDTLCTGLKADIERAAERIIANLNHEITIEGQSIFCRLKPQKRADLFLFYKECLINICRHSGASKLSTHLSASPKEIRLTVTDNGSGFKGSADSVVPSSLMRRATLLGANVTTEHPPEGGTRITLAFLHKMKRLKRLKH